MFFSVDERGDIWYNIRLTSNIWRLRQTLLPHLHYIILSVSVKQENESPISNSRIKVVCCSMVNTESKSAFSLMFLTVLTKKHNSIFFRLTQKFFCDILKGLLLILKCWLDDTHTKCRIFYINNRIIIWNVN
jgi:hypothetical protein